MYVLLIMATFWTADFRGGASVAFTQIEMRNAETCLTAKKKVEANTNTLQVRALCIQRN